MGPGHLRNSNGKSTEATIALMSTNQCASISTHIYTYIYSIYILCCTSIWKIVPSPESDSEILPFYDGLRLPIECIANCDVGDPTQLALYAREGWGWGKLAPSNLPFIDVSNQLLFQSVMLLLLLLLLVVVVACCCCCCCCGCGSSFSSASSQDPRGCMF